MKSPSVAALLCVLALLVAAGGATDAELYQHDRCRHLADLFPKKKYFNKLLRTKNRQETSPNQFGRLGDTTYINDYMDCMMPTISEVMKENGMDPMPLPELYDGFYYKPLLVEYKAGITLHDGKMYNMDSIHRSSDAWMSHFANMHRFHNRFGFRDLDFIYDYRTEVMYAWVTGRVVGTLDEMHALTDVLLDRNNCEIHLQQFSLTHSRLRVRLEGNFLTDWLVSPIVAMFTRLFDDVIIRDVENKMRAGIQEELMLLNARLRDYNIC